MRQLTNRESLERFMRELAKHADRPANIYFTGGATAVLYGWRNTTVDIDLVIQPESDRLLRAIPTLKEQLQVNVELACPSHFIPEVPGWEKNSSAIESHGKLHFFHYNFYAQALAKIERGHDRDLEDVVQMTKQGLIVPEKLRETFLAIEPQLYRFPAIDPATFRRAVEEELSKLKRYCVSWIS